MKRKTVVHGAAALVLCLGASPALADKFVCKCQSGGPRSSFAMTIDFDAKTVDLPSKTGFQPDSETVDVTDATVKWSFMRGFVDFDRHTRVLDWDTTAEYDYLTAIDQAPDDPEANYKGRMQCEASH